MKSQLITLAVLSSGLITAQAAVLAQFSNDSVAETDNNFADEANANNVTVSALTFTPAAATALTDGPSGETNLQFNTGNNFRQSRTEDGDPPMTSADAQDRFATFSVTADQGFLINLNATDAFSYVIGANTGNAFPAKTNSLAYVSDQADFSNILFESEINQVEDNTNNGINHTFTTYNLNPTADAVGTYETLYFAVEATVFNNNNTNKKVNAGEFSFDSNVVTNPVPEPSSSALLALSGLALIARRRR